MTTRILRSSLCLVAVATLSLGCAKEKPAESPPAESSAEPETIPGKDPKQAQIVIDPSIAEACGITEKDAFFSYNSANVSSGADAIFTKLAECFTKGKLAGKTMRLVGHADPRGDEEYNLTLGGKRADNVSAALTKKGMPDAQMTSTSRGELDARGEDEAGWAADRKVEILLAK